MKRFFLFSLVLVSWAQADFPVGRVLTQSTQTVYGNGKYTSIFGIVPGTAGFTANDRRTTTIERPNENELVIKLSKGESITRFEPPNQEASELREVKPLVGESVLLTKSDGEWKASVREKPELTPLEQKELARLVARFKPGGDPFSPSQHGGQEEKFEVHATAFAKFLGFSDPTDAAGNVDCTRASSQTPSRTPLDLVFEVAFNSGVKEELVNVELSGKGSIVRDESTDLTVEAVLSGTIAIHGMRKLEDGRVVPYNRSSTFDYKMTLEPAKEAVPSVEERKK